jgi:LacI family transcriptional regulator
MQQIAEELGISRTTVSLCLSGKAAKYKINPETRKKVLDYALKIGFVSNRLAQTVAHGKNDEIGVLYSFSRKDDSRVDALFYLVEHLTRIGRKFQIHHIDADTFVKEIMNLKGMGISDIIVVSKENLTLNELDSIRPYIKNLRLFFNNMLYPHEITLEKNVFIVETNRQKAYKEACEYLYSLGHRVVLADNNNIEYINSLNIFDEVHKLDFLRVDMKRFFSGFSVGREYGSKVISAMRSKGITAVLSHNYQYAQGIIQKLLENKIKVPEDISVLCFGDFESNKYFKIPLTAINVPVFEMVDAIICRMEAEKFDLSLVNIDSELKIRESTGPVRK